MICARTGCGTVFCYDDADMLLVGSNPKLYCSGTCKRRAEARRTAQRERQDAAAARLAARWAPARA